MGTHIEVEAQKKAQEIYHSLRGNGWQETLKKYKPDALVVPAGPPITVGEFLASFERVFTGKRTTLTEYGQDFRRVAGDIAGLPRLRANDEKHNALLRPRVDAVQQTEAWIREGKRARSVLKQFLAELRGLALASGEPCAIDGVEKVRLFVLGNVMRLEELPNWDGAGGLN